MRASGRKAPTGHESQNRPSYANLKEGRRSLRFGARVGNTVSGVDLEVGNTEMKFDDKHPPSS